jgi:hypothetical protein
LLWHSQAYISSVQAGGSVRPQSCSEQTLDEPVVLRIVRPYATEDAFLAAESWTLDAKGALLIDQPPLEVGTLLRFDLLLSSGTRLVRAEGRVVKHIPRTPARPGGLRVRFTRFGGSSKALIDRVVLLRRQSTFTQSEAPSEARSSVRATEAPIQLTAARPATGEPGTLQRALRERAVRQVVAPENRNELLARLRARARKSAS